MKKQTFSILVDASRERVWEILLGESTYPVWTSVFAEGSTVETDWQEGSRAVFHDGKGQGMVSHIERNIPNEFLSIKHLGFIKDGVEDFDSPEVKKWAGALENYTLNETNGKTELVIDLHVDEEHLKYFDETWPKALEKVKELSEMQQTLA
ncbi:SRPBCC domain-containing protein [Pedobacter sp. SYSU D00535]|uniref:SRPBCC domain-containing protein n=1 Tax=Pedobacter sp. SYSU D00535 TaxID=2810308 RepID=UPI001A95E6A9|nr:SRPBCC domain-containing protein [Pedobacter sp. SYSU D00535]